MIRKQSNSFSFYFLVLFLGFPVILVQELFVRFAIREIRKQGLSYLPFVEFIARNMNIGELINLLQVLYKRKEGK